MTMHVTFYTIDIPQQYLGLHNSVVSNVTCHCSHHCIVAIIAIVLAQIKSKPSHQGAKNLIDLNQKP